MEAFSNIREVKRLWHSHKNIFLDLNFIKCFYNNHQNIRHIFLTDKDINIYCHIFKLRLTNTVNYLNNYLIFKPLFSALNINVLYLTNSFITNVPSFSAKKKITISKLINTIEKRNNFFLIAIPDFLFQNLKGNLKKEFTKVEIESEMILTIRPNWIEIDDYLNDLKRKYRNKFFLITKKSSLLQIRKLEYNDVANYKDKVADLFNNIIDNSKFSGPKFNTETLFSLMKSNYINLYGYFLNENLIAFSSEIFNNNILYSYYVGFDKDLNKKYSLYGRILIETIKNGIHNKVEKIIFGRTANEYKSNFGATSSQSFVFLKSNNKYTEKIFQVLFKLLKVKPWKTRSPFKKGN